MSTNDGGPAFPVECSYNGEEPMTKLTKAARNLKPCERLCKRCSGSGFWVEKDKLCFRCYGTGTEPLPNLKSDRGAKI